MDEPAKERVHRFGLKVWVDENGERHEEPGWRGEIKDLLQPRIYEVFLRLEGVTPALARLIRRIESGERRNPAPSPDGRTIDDLD